MSFSPASASVVTPVTIPGVTPSITSGLPALPIPTMRFPLIPMSAFRMPSFASTARASSAHSSSYSARRASLGCCGLSRAQPWPIIRVASEPASVVTVPNSRGMPAAAPDADAESMVKETRWPIVF